MGQVTGFGLQSAIFGVQSASDINASRAPQGTASAVEQEIRELTRKVAAAVHELNDVNYAGHGREITFSVDRATRLPVVKVVDLQSKEIIRQWPAEYVLQAARTEIHQKGT